MAFLRSNPDSGEAPRPGARERSRMRRRLRRQRQMREALLLDLGALVFELHRQGRREPELLQAKAAELTAVDEEVRALAEALGSDNTIMQLVATGVAGSCENCGSLMSVDARYCASCGAPAVPALTGDGVGAGALATVEESSVFSPPFSEEDSAEEELPEEETVDEEELAEEPDEEETAYDEPVEEEMAEEAFVEEDEGVESEPHEPDDEIRVTRLEPEEAEPEEPEPEEPEPEEAEPEEAEPEPESEVEPDEAAEAPEPPWGAPEGEEKPAARDASDADGPPRALADDALDSAARAIRTSLARGRDWIRGRRTGG